MCLEGLEVGEGFEPAFVFGFEFCKAAVGPDLLIALYEYFVDGVEDGPFRHVESAVVDEGLWEVGKVVEYLWIEEFTRLEFSEGYKVRVSSESGE